jgi:hypothetical protein
VAPLLALTDQTVAFALVLGVRASEHWRSSILHMCSFLAIARRCGRRRVAALARNRASSAATGEATVQSHFLAGVAMMVAALSAVAIAAMWIPTWMISSCIA